MNKFNNIENTEKVNGSSQSRRESVMKRARKYAMSVAFAAAVFTVLFVGATTTAAQAQNSKCFYNSNVEATCPVDSNSGYYYEKINGRWQNVSYYKRASGNTLYIYLYAQRIWAFFNEANPQAYIQTNSGWMELIEYERAVAAKYGAGSTKPIFDMIIKTSNNLPGKVRQRPW